MLQLQTQDRHDGRDQQGDAQRRRQQAGAQAHQENRRENCRHQGGDEDDPVPGLRRDGGVGPAENLGLQLTGEEPNGRDGQRQEAGLGATGACPLAGKGACDQEGGDRDQSRYRQPADDAELPVLRAEQGTQAGKRHQRASVGDDFSGANRAIAG